MTQAPLLADLLASLERRYPVASAESWDSVGLVAGDPKSEISRVLFAVDPVNTVIDEALDWGADLIVTHHPLLLRPVTSVAADTYKGSLIHRLISNGCAIYTAHTNADSATGGVADGLADLFGLHGTVPLVPASVGHNEPGSVQTGLGRVGYLNESTTLEAFARLVARSLPKTHQGVRVAGDLNALISKVAVLGGSGDSLFDDVRASGADVYVTSDLRHHPASELRERASFEAETRGEAPATGKPFLIDTAHFASEWPWLAHAAKELAAEYSASGMEVKVSDTVTDPWDARFDS